MKLVPVVMVSLVALLACAGCQNTPNSNPTPAAAAAAERSGQGGFQDTFKVAKTDLGPTGTATHFSLVPGTVHTYKEEGTTLVIRVLNETKIVDGVTTRVIEEREDDTNGPKEISRNYFAIDRTTGDVYYFGEDVDMYKNGKVTGHAGSWLSGVNGARFGLAMPGHPAVGAKFHQEVASGVAMDRVEIVSVDERIQTPAGVFEHCVHAKETTPLDKDTGHKWYAPGVGLIKDDDFVLVKREPAEK
jgi:hypothetical protein